MKTHKLKLNIEFCDAVLRGEKTFEIRYDDRNYKVGDLIKFAAVNNREKYIHHEIKNHTYKITYILSGWVLKDGYVALGIKEAEK
ncbi:MAG: DUF3850 domain-containing protein [Ruminococcus sp.]|nr:DUF3850 domain-containing protein [Ruminococcus sp.]